ncbi:MAG: hypothetical protein KBA28_12905 [Syntrophaceae bacterium]|jgi:hypothetical protein|nr:hypothetical protein [Syntrophaceae bacterium]
MKKTWSGFTCFLWMSRPGRKAISMSPSGEQGVMETDNLSRPEALPWIPPAMFITGFRSFLLLKTKKADV